MPKHPIYTIGYGARELEAFLIVLRAHGILYLIDVRSSPYSRYKPEFSKNALQHFLEANGVRYVFMGEALGGRPDDEKAYTDGKVDYEKLADRAYFQAGIDRLRQANRQGQRVVLMCSEGKPENCHRTKLIGRTLSDEGIEVVHIDEEDALLSQADVMLRLTGGQPNLFGEEFNSTR